MALALTPYIKLKVDSDLSSDSKYNLNRIDELGSLFQIDTNAVAQLRSKTNIVMQPQSAFLGGTGIGGVINLGTVDQPADSVNIYASSFTVSAAISSSSGLSTSGSVSLLNSNYSLNLTAPTLTDSLTLTLPSTVGSPNQVLTTDGAGVLSWTTVGGVSIGQELTSTWLLADGTEKTITHNFGTRNIIVQIIDPSDDYRTVEVDSVQRPTVNTVVLSSSIAPAVSWIVMLKEIN
jgi:hypothetical protein